MTTHRDVAGLCAALYGEAGAPDIEWTARSGSDASVFWAAVRIGRILYVVCRGSFTFKDWVHDVLALARSPLRHPELGPIHPGFYIGVENAWASISSMIGDKDLVVFAGHSLGAAHADMLAARMILEGGTPHALLCWGEPKPGFQRFADLLKGVPGVSYRNETPAGGDQTRFDLVAELPLSFPPEMYVHRQKLTSISMPPAAGMVADLGPSIALHHFVFYRAATPETVIPE